MLLKRADIEEFQALWKAEFGEVISSAKAELTASRLIELYVELVEHVETSHHPQP